MIWKLAWRNIFRNKRRTYITAASIALAVLTAASMRAIQKGAWDNMVDNVVKYYTGYAQIHANGYWEDKTIDLSFAYDEQVSSLATSIASIDQVVPRIESFALAAYGNKSNGTLVVGVDPIEEDNFTNLSDKVTQGAYLDPKDDGALVAEGLAEILNVGLGDTLTLLSQGYHGATAAGNYPIKGLVKFASPQLNRQMIYLSLDGASDFYDSQGLITSAAINLNSPDQLELTTSLLKAQLDPKTYEIKDYREMMPELMQAKELDIVSGYITLAILYLIIAFGIFGTILMMVKERTYEFGILLSIGMNRAKLGMTVWLETIFIGLLGACIGILISMPIVAWFSINPIRMTGEAATAYEKFGVEPIFPAAFDISIFLSQAFLVLIMTSILALYPIMTLQKLDPVQAMRA